MGIMGLSMAQNARKAGFEVYAFNRSDKRRQMAQKAGLALALHAKEVAEQSDAVVVMVTDPKAVADVLSGPVGILSGHVQGKTLIQMSTLDEKSTLHFAKEAQEKGMVFLDCPVTGSKKQVEAAQLIILAGGDRDLINKWTPFFHSIGKTVIHAGDVGKGTVLKLCMNLIVAQMTTALCESVALGKLLNLDPKKIFDVISVSPALNCGYYQIKKEALLNDDFTPAFSLENMLKDVRFMDQAAKEKRLPLPVTQAVKYLMESAMADGLGDQDLTAISKILKSKVEVIP